MTRVLSLFAWILLMGLEPAESVGERPERPEVSTGESSIQTKPVDDLLRNFLTTHEIPGAAVAIAKEGKLLYARGFGYADLESSSPVQPDSQFRIASISKPITATAVLNLVEAGKIQLDGSILKQLPVKFRETEPADTRWKQITVRHCLQHTGGWNREASGDPMFKTVAIAADRNVPSPADVENIILYQLGQRLDFNPGEEYHYSNFGYALLGRVIEQASGQSYEDYVKEEILKPLKMNNTHLGRTRQSLKLPQEVTYYNLNDRTGTSIFPEDQGKKVTWPYGMWTVEVMDSHGGWVSTAPDLVRFGLSFSQKRHPILSQRVIRTLFECPDCTHWRTENGDPTDYWYACGWLVRPVGQRGANIWHGGRLAGTSTILVGRHDGFVWAILFNQGLNSKGEALSGLIDSEMHRAVNQVRDWPRTNLFSSFSEEK